MMMGDVLRACSLYHSSSGPTSVKVGSQLVGLLSVLAISGSVALLTLGKQKLWHYVFDTTEEPSSSIAWQVSLGSRDVAPGVEYSCGEGEEEANGGIQVLPCSTATTTTEPRKRFRLKKVRFAPEVVEPKGDGQEYRRRIMAKQQQPEPSKSKKTSNLESCREINAQKRAARSTLPANRIALYNGLRQNRLQQQALYCT